MIRTWCDGVGIRVADDDSQKILEHLVTAPDFEVTTTSGRTIAEYATKWGGEENWFERTAYTSCLLM